MRTLSEFLATAVPTGACEWGETVDGRMSCIVHHHTRDKTPAETGRDDVKADVKMFAKLDRKADAMQARLI